ncbi:dsDNA nuclease domain-containing protein [Paenibacillus jamilae]|uniref:dsDNA nuclease domain-containing protein n=1 Tax=Paenibacillus jamilae TaxID=114136 RepID=UPI003D2BABEB
MNALDQICEHYMKNQDDKSTEDRVFLETNIIGKSSEEIADFLACTAPDETGGLTAITGFYYQFLVAIEYIIGMLEGHWEYVFIEHHDDVVVGKDNTIRFIQVKTSEKVKVDVTASPASGLYTRSKKNVQGISMRRNNSWIDKMITKAELLKKVDGYITQFQLYSSYHFIKTANFNFDLYTGNKLYDLDIPSTDHLLVKFNESVCDKEGNPYDYEAKCGEKPKELLGRFYLHTGPSLNELEAFKNHLCMRLNKWLFQDIGDNISIVTEDIHAIIGHLCTKCTHQNNPERLLVTKEKMENILSDIRERSLSAVNVVAERHGSLSVATRVIDSLVSELENNAHSGLLKDKLYTYREYFKNWLSCGGDIRSLFERYAEGTIKTSVYTKINETNREQRLQDFFCIVLILIMIRDSSLEFTDTKGLLTKECRASNLLFSFLSLETRNNFASGVQKLETIIQQSDISDHLFMVSNELRIVFQNYSDRKFTTTIRQELRNKPEIPLEGFEDEQLLNKVTLVADIIPGKLLKEEFFECLNEETDFQQKMQEIWIRYQDGVE